MNDKPIEKTDSEAVAGRAQRLVMALVISALLYQTVAWGVFQWRNPLSNEMSFYRNFLDVATWKKLPEYQP